MGLQGSPEASLCKFGLFLLRAALPPADVDAQPWSIFLCLYELLDEYALHLIQVLQELSQGTDLLQGPHELLSRSVSMLIYELMGKHALSTGRVGSVPAWSKGRCRINAHQSLLGDSDMLCDSYDPALRSCIYNVDICPA